MSHRPLPNVAVHILRGRSARKSRELTGPALTIGSAGDCEIQMRSAEVAVRHCRILRQPGRALAECLDARFPTFVNGRAVLTAELNDGDILRIGPFEIQVSVTHAEASGPDANDADEGRGSGQTRHDPKATDPVPAAHADQRGPSTPAGLMEQASSGRSAGESEGLARAERSLEALQADLANRREIAAPTPPSSEPRSRPRRASTLGSDKLAERVAPASPVDDGVATEEEARRRARREDLERRERDLAAAATKLDEREAELRRGEATLESRRSALTDELAAFEHRQQEINGIRRKLLRIRRRLVRHHQRRRTAHLDLDGQLAKRALALDERQRSLDEELARWKSRDEELDANRHDLNRQRQELRERAAALQEEETRFRDLWQRLEADRGISEERLRRLDLEEQSLSQRAEHLSRREAEVASLLDQTRLESRRIEDELGSLARHQERESARHDRESADLVARSADLDRRDQDLSRRGDELSVREREITQRGESLDRREAELTQLRVKLDRREEELTRREREVLEHIRLQRDEAERQRLAALELSEQRRRLETLDEELRTRADAAGRQELSARAEVDRARELAAEVERARQSLGDQQDRFESERGRWTTRLNRLREWASEVAQRSAIIKVRERNLGASERAQRERDESLAAVRRELDAQRRSVAGDRESVEDSRRQLTEERTRLDREGAKLREESLRLASESARLTDEAGRLARLVAAVEGREQDLLEREARWREDVKLRREELERLGERIRVDRTELDRRADLHRKHLTRIRAVGAKLIDRKLRTERDVAQAEERHRSLQERLDFLRRSQRDIHDAILAETRGAWERELEVERWFEQLGAESRRLAAIHASLGVAAGRLGDLALTLRLGDGEAGPRADVASTEVGLGDPGQAASEVGSDLERCEGELGQLEERIRERERMLHEGRDRLDSERRRVESLLDRARAAETDAESLLLDPDTPLSADVSRLTAAAAATLALPSDPASQVSIGPPAHSDGGIPVQIVDDDAPGRHESADAPPLHSIVLDGSSNAPSPSSEFGPPGSGAASTFASDGADAFDPERNGHDEPEDEFEAGPDRVPASTAGLGPALSLTRPSVPPPAGPAARTAPSPGSTPAPQTPATVATPPQSSMYPPVSDRSPPMTGVKPPIWSERPGASAGYLPKVEIAGIEFERLLHAGSIADTYLARRAGLKERLVARLLKPIFCRDRSAQDRYLRSLTAAMAFRHPNAVALVGPLRTADRVGELREFIEGITLAGLLGVTVPPQVIADVVRQLLGVLAAVRQAGLAPPALRPERVLVSTAGAVKLLGAGEPAWLMGLHRCENAAGFDPWTAPEQRGAEPAGPRGELWSVGRMMLTWLDARPGRKGLRFETDLPPVDAGTLRALLSRFAAEQPKDRPESASQALAELLPLIPPTPMRHAG
jgi:chromosome segregation ATPase